MKDPMLAADLSARSPLLLRDRNWGDIIGNSRALWDPSLRRIKARRATARPQMGAARGRDNAPRVIKLLRPTA